MDPFTIDILAGTIVAIIGAFIGGYVNKKFFIDESILTLHKEKGTGKQYAHLEGKWYEYHITFDRRIQPDPFWLQGIYNLTINKGNLLKGSFEITHYPTAKLTYKSKGEIRNGRMILIHDCEQDPSEFASTLFSNLLDKELLIGIMTGFDWQHRPFSVPQIISRNELNIEKLTNYLGYEEIKHIYNGKKIEKLFGN